MEALRLLERAHADEAKVTAAIHAAVVEDINKAITDYYELLNGALNRVTKAQEDAFYTEYKADKNMPTLRQWIDRAVAALRGLNIPLEVSDEKKRKKLLIEFEELDKQVHQLEDKEIAELTTQFQILEREYLEKHGAFSEQTWKAFPVMRTIQGLRRLRRKYAKEQSEEKSLIHDNQQLFEIITALSNTQDPKMKHKIFKQLNYRASHIEDVFADFRKLLQEMIDVYTLMIKVSAIIHQKLVDEKGFGKNILYQLNNEHYPQDAYKAMTKIIDDQREKTKEQVGQLLDAMRRATRKQKAEQVPLKAA